MRHVAISKMPFSGCTHDAPTNCMQENNIGFQGNIFLAYLPALFFEILWCPEHLFQGPWDHPLFFRVRSVPFHRVSFPWARLSIGKYTHVIAIESGLDQLRNFTENIFLTWRRVKDPIESEFVFWRGFFSSANTLWIDNINKDECVLLKNQHMATR